MTYSGGIKWWPLVALPWIPIVLYALLVFIDASLIYKSIKIGMVAIASSYIQLMGYGTGFIWAWWQRCFLHREEFHAFENNFYK